MMELQDTSYKLQDTSPPPAPPIKPPSECSKRVIVGGVVEGTINVGRVGGVQRRDAVATVVGVKIGLLFKPDLKEYEHITSMLHDISATQDVSFHILDTKQKYSQEHASKEHQLSFILAFGGDGTMLRTLDYSLYYAAPVLGINLGKLGFLTDISLKELRQAINDLINKHYRLEQRMLLDVKVYRDGKLYISGTALNDAVISKGSEAKLVNIRLYSNRQIVYDTRCDGIVVSTPTGATAYSLSAGGPIISPAMQAIILTPLNPHILTVRPMVFEQSEVTEIKLLSENQVHLHIDGLNKGELSVNDRIVIKKSKQTINFVKLSQKTFYKILRRKLKMGKI